MNQEQPATKTADESEMSLEELARRMLAMPVKTREQMAEKPKPQTPLVKKARKRKS
jgi:hypothetical protein